MPSPRTRTDPRIGEPIAVVGMGCRFPGARGRRRRSGGCFAMGSTPSPRSPADRWDRRRFYDPDPATPGKMNTDWGGFLEQVDRFDAAVLRHLAARGGADGPAAAAAARGRLGSARGRRPGAAGGWPASRTGVFVGISTNDYSRLAGAATRARSTPTSAPATPPSIAANRLSYVFDFRGPSLAVDTACSSSLVAVHLACQSLRSGECDLPLAGGVNLILSPELTIVLSPGADAGRRRALQDLRRAADGYVRGEGCGVVVLKRLVRRAGATATRSSR